MPTQEWIITRTDDHRPHLIGSNPSPFRTYAEGSDPNGSGGNIDNGIDLTYLMVSRPGQPVVENDVLERLVATETLGDNGIAYPGKYVAPNWVVGWDVVPQTIDAARFNKIAKLNTARDERIAVGYELDGGTYPIPLTDEMGQNLAYQASQFKAAVAAGSITANEPIYFYGAGEPIQLGVETLEQHSAAFWLARRALNGAYLDAVAAINSAETPALVDAVTWEF